MKRALMMILIILLAFLFMTGCAHRVSYETYYEPVRVYKVKRVVYYEHHEPVTYVKEKPVYIHGHSHGHSSKKVVVVKKKVKVKKGKQHVFNHHAPHTKKKKVHKKKVHKRMGPQDGI